MKDVLRRCQWHIHIVPYTHTYIYTYIHTYIPQQAVLLPESMFFFLTICSPIKYEVLRTCICACACVCAYARTRACERYVCVSTYWLCKANNALPSSQLRAIISVGKVRLCSCSGLNHQSAIAKRYKNCFFWKASTLPEAMLGGSSHL